MTLHQQEGKGNSKTASEASKKGAKASQSKTNSKQGSGSSKSSHK